MYGLAYHQLEMPRLSFRQEANIRKRCEPKLAKQLIGVFYSGHGIDREQFLGILSSQGVDGLLRQHDYLINPT